MADADEEHPPQLSALQDAALQLLGAAKAFITAAENAVTDPKTLGRIGDVVNEAVADIARFAGRVVSPQPSPPEEGDRGVEHIDLSE